MKKMNLGSKSKNNANRVLFEICVDFLFKTQLMSRKILILRGDSIMNILFPEHSRKVEEFDVVCLTKEDFVAAEELLSILTITLRKNKAVTKCDRVKDPSNNSTTWNIYSRSECISFRLRVGSVDAGSIARYDTKQAAIVGDSIDTLIAHKLALVLDKDRTNHMEAFYDLFIALSHSKDMDIGDVVAFMPYKETAAYYSDLEDLTSEQSILQLSSLWDAATFYSHFNGSELKKPDFQTVFEAIRTLNFSIMRRLEEC